MSDPSPRGDLPGLRAPEAPVEVPEADAYVCRWSPSTCMDDLCRNSSVGLCGNTDADFADPEDDDELDDHWGPCCETGECDD